eukprot:jgi/Botrbrau1/2216/Bobra.101_2s0045.1
MDHDLDEGGGGAVADDNGPHNLREDIFNIIRPHEWAQELSEPPGLVSFLFPYQRRALSWMSWREQKCNGGPEATVPPQRVDALADTATEMELDDESQAPGEVAVEPLVAVDSIPGGILADEMGLGKTVEVIALNLHRPPPTSGPWVQNRQRGGVLIVTPAHILQQWRSEMERHAPGLKVLAYDGYLSTLKFKEKTERKAAAAQERAMKKAKRSKNKESFMKMVETKLGEAEGNFHWNHRRAGL